MWAHASMRRTIVLLPEALARLGRLGAQRVVLLLESVLQYHELLLDQQQQGAGVLVTEHRGVLGRQARPLKVRAIDAAIDLARRVLAVRARRHARVRVLVLARLRVVRILLALRGRVVLRVEVEALLRGRGRDAAAAATAGDVRRARETVVVRHGVVVGGRVALGHVAVSREQMRHVGRARGRGSVRARRVLLRGLVGGGAGEREQRHGRGRGARGRRGVRRAARLGRSRRGRSYGAIHRAVAIVVVVLVVAISVVMIGVGAGGAGAGRSGGGSGGAGEVVVEMVGVVGVLARRVVLDLVRRWTQQVCLDGIATARIHRGRRIRAPPLQLESNPTAPRQTSLTISISRAGPIDISREAARVSY